MTSDFYEIAFKVILVICVAQGVLTVIIVSKFFEISKYIKDIRDKLLVDEINNQKKEMPK